MLTEAAFGNGPMSDRVIVLFTVAGVLGAPPVAFRRRVALQVKRLLRGLAFAGVEYELWHAATVPDKLGLVCGHIVANAMFGLAGGVALEEGGAAIIDPVEHRPV